MFTKEQKIRYKCKTCGKVFGENDDLRKHIRSVHEGIKNHVCETCGKAFSENRNLKKHILSVHDGVITDG